MRFIEFKKSFESFKIFSTTDIRKWDEQFDTRRLVEWQEKKYIVKVINKWYMFDRPQRTEELLLVSNRIYSPSYISLEWALSFYGIIPEGVYTATAVTSLKTQLFNTSVGAFSYKHIKPSLLFGYRLINFEDTAYRLAEPEKALLDFLYLNASLSTVDDIAGVRFNELELDTVINIDKLTAYLKLFANKSLDKRVNSVLRKNLDHA